MHFFINSAGECRVVKGKNYMLGDLSYLLIICVNQMQVSNY